MSNVSKNRELLPVTVYVEPLTSSVAYPVISPLVLLNSSPSGSAGDIDHEDTFPPKIWGSMYTSSMLVVILSSLSR